MSFIPSNNMEDPPVHPNDDPIDRTDESLQTMIPNDPNKPYDMKELISKVVDKHNFFEIMPLYAQNIVIGFARFDGRTEVVTLILAGVAMNAITGWLNRPSNTTGSQIASPNKTTEAEVTATPMKE